MRKPTALATGSRPVEGVGRMVFGGDVLVDVVVDVHLLAAQHEVGVVGVGDLQASSSM